MRSYALAALMLLAACADGGMDYQTYLAKKGVKPAPAGQIAHCRGYGCRITDTVALADADWQAFRAPFAKVRTAEQERQAIAAAIGIFETRVGAITGTEADRAGTYLKIGDNQHDCVDESVNTTIYLAALTGKGLLKFHSVGAPSARVPPFSRGLGPHQTAVITETATQQRYAVDSWFHDNGHPAEIVPMDEWFFGWRPKSE